MEVIYLGCILGLAIKISNSYCKEPKENTSTRTLILIILLGVRIGFVLSNFLLLLVVCLMVCTMFQSCYIQKYISVLVNAWGLESNTICEFFFSGFENVAGVKNIQKNDLKGKRNKSLDVTKELNWHLRDYI